MSINDITIKQIRALLVVAMRPRATGYEFDEVCPFCGGDSGDGEGRSDGWRHADDCIYIGIDPESEVWPVRSTRG